MLHARLLLVLALLLLAAGSRADVTTDTVAIGGPGTSGCSSADDPPTLDDGLTLASGEIGFSYDESTRVLSVTVTNTSPVTAGVPNPLVTEVFLNLPAGAVSGVQLVSQTGSGGAAPAFELGVDTDVADGTKRLTAGCFGAFGLRLSAPGGIQGAIANADADTISAPPGSWVVGPVTFELAVSGPGVDTLSATAFSHSFSHNPPGSKSVNAVLKFQAGGAAGASDKLGNGPNCEPGTWMIGQPCIGNTVTFVMSGSPGCDGCLFFSTNPGPTLFGDTLLPIGPPVFPLLVAFLPPGQTISLPVTIPVDAALVDVTFYFLVATVDPGSGLVEFSDGFSATICQ